jgi:cytochrome P450
VDPFESINLINPNTHASDLSQFWRNLRQEAPLAWHAARDDMPGFWVVSRYADIVRICKDSQRFTSAQGNMLGTALRGGDPAAGKMLVVTDGPRHSALRRLLARGGAGAGAGATGLGAGAGATGSGATGLGASVA